jgi:hypothetical protein
MFYMKMTRPYMVLLAMMAGWLNRHQQDMINYLKEENEILREKLGTKRLILSDEQKKRLARLAKNIGHRALSEICGVFSPGTLLKWHRMLVPHFLSFTTMLPFYLPPRAYRCKSNYTLWPDRYCST